jgi:hypothetical protein
MSKKYARVNNLLLRKVLVIKELLTKRKNQHPGYATRLTGINQWMKMAWNSGIEKVLCFC